MIDPRVWPDTVAVDAGGRLRVAGKALDDLAERYGTPLYLYDALTVRAAYRAYVAAFRGARPVRVSYSIKACALASVAALLARLGADASAASLGEALAARRAGFPASRIQLHGNAKTDDELAGALRLGVGRIVIDGAQEIERLARLVRRRAPAQRVWLRVSPGIDVDTHPYLRTAILDSKFGAPIEGGEALRQARAIAETPGLRLVGVHAHLGTEVRDAEPYRALTAALVEFAHEVHAATGAAIEEVGVGGGVSIALRREDEPLDLATYAAAAAGPLRADATFSRATLYLEPGRWLVGRAGVALYRVVGTKRVKGVRTFVAVDGGMGDNIRPALYGARYTAALVARARAEPDEEVAIAGKYCEGGDILVAAVALPTPRTGEVLAVPGAGAYAIAMASNYNHHPRPAVVLLDRGHAKVIRRRERYADLWRLES